MASKDFALVACAFARFGIDPRRALKIKDEVEGLALLIACSQAVQTEQERIRLEEAKFQSELTARRVYDYLVLFWEGGSIKPISELFADDRTQEPEAYTRNGKQYQVIDGEVFEVVG